MVVEANDVGMLESFEHLGLFSEPLPLTFVQFLLLCKQKIVRLFMEAERELIGCQSRTDVIIRSSRHGATGAFTLPRISGENSIVAIHGAKSRLLTEIYERKISLSFQKLQRSGMPLSKNE